MLKVVGGTARGKNTAEQQRAQILQQIVALEALNPTPNPADSDLLSGCWALLYQGGGVGGGRRGRGSRGQDQPYLPADCIFP